MPRSLNELAEAPASLLVVLGDDQAALGHGAPGDALAARGPRAAELERVAAAHGHELEHARVVGRHELQAGHLVAEQLAGAEADRVEHVLAHGAVGDRALDAGEPLEQLLALLERVEQALVQLRLHLGLVALAALLGGEPEQAQRQAQHVRHAAREVDLVARESRCRRGRTRAATGVSASTVIASAGRSRDGRARSVGRCCPSAMSASAASSTGSRRKPTEATTSPRLEQHGHVGAERLGRPLDGHAARGALVLGGRDHREEAGELLDRPVARRAGRGGGGDLG